MKNAWHKLVLAAAAMATMTTWGIGIASAHAELRVAATIKPIHSLVAGVMEGVGEPELLMAGMASPHTYQLRPSQAGLLVHADLVIWVAPGVEASFPETLDMLPSNVTVIRAIEVPGLELHSARPRGVWTADGGSDRVGAEGVADPHIWLSPRNAIILTQMFVEELSRLDPANAATYRSNGVRQRARLSVLDSELRKALRPVRHIPFMTFHDAFQYFERSFGLNNVAAIAISPERPPGARTIMELRYAIMDEGIACVFAEPQFEPRLARTLTEGTAARIGTLDPLGEAIAPGPSAYIQTMTALATATLACLAPDQVETGD